MRRNQIYLWPALVLLIAVLLLAVSYLTRPCLYFWKMEAKGKTVYMLGTIHVFSPELADRIDKKIIQALENCDLILIERIDLKREGYFYPHGDSLINHLPEEDYDQMKKMIAGVNLDIEDYIQYRPGRFEQAMRILSAQIFGYYDYYWDGVDLYFFNMAVKKGFRYDALEQKDHYAEFIESDLSETELGYYLVLRMQYLFGEGDEIKESLNFMMDSWLDLSLDEYREKIEQERKELVPEEKKELDEIVSEKYRIINTKRNIIMADRIEEFLNSDNCTNIFAMAGGAHFAYEDSIIDILRERGYKIKRIKRSLPWPF